MHIEANFLRQAEVMVVLNSEVQVCCNTKKEVTKYVCRVLIMEYKIMTLSDIVNNLDGNNKESNEKAENSEEKNEAKEDIITDGVCG